MSLKQKGKRIIRVKNLQLRGFRTAMRELLKAAQVSEVRRLRDKSNSVNINQIERGRRIQLK